MDIKQKLKEQMGYIGQGDIHAVGVAYGWNLPVVVKDVYGEREIMTIDKVINLPKSKSDKIREVFIVSEIFRELFD